MKAETDIALLKKDVKEIKEDINEIRKSLDKSFVELKKNLDDMKTCYVRVERFTPIEKGFYGLITTIVLAVITALLATVVRAG